jgi:hypothetical protein
MFSLLHLWKQGNGLLISILEIFASWSKIVLKDWLEIQFTQTALSA